VITTQSRNNQVLSLLIPHKIEELHDLGNISAENAEVPIKS